MKLYKYAISMAVAASSVAMVSCDNDFDRPPVIVPVATIEANTAISELKETYWSEISENKYATIPVNAAGDSIVIAGTVISSDKSGNIYKGIYLRDETGVTYLRVNAYDLYESYQPGQEVRINVTGLLIGGYGRAPQMGSLYNNGVGQIAEAEFKVRAQCNGLPVKDAAAPVETTIADLNSYKTNTADLQTWMFQLVRLNDVKFEDGGSKLWTDKPGDTGSTSRTISDAAGNTIIAYTSNKATFASEVLPKGTGSITAILSYYNGTWQLLVMDPSTDCEGFEFVDTPETPANPDAPAGAIFSETFKTGKGDFTIENVNAPTAVGEIWKHDSKYGYMIATAYVSSDKSNHASESWLISPVIDLTGQSAAYLSFDQAMNYFTSIAKAQSETTVNIREEGAQTWTKLTVPSYPDALGWDFKGSGSIDLSAYLGKKVQIGFCYTSTDTKAGTWEIKNVLVSPQGTPSTPDQPSTPSTGGFTESFASGQGGFTIENVTMGGELNYVWNHDSNYACMKASAYVNGSSHASDSWLISPVISLEGMTAPKLSFEHAVNKFPSVDTAKEQISVCVRLEGATDWVKLPLQEFGSNSSWTFFSSGDISLADYAGKKVQIAFHYTSTDTASGTWEVKNVNVK